MSCRHYKCLWFWVFEYWQQECTFLKDCDSKRTRRWWQCCLDPSGQPSRAAAEFSISCICWQTTFSAFTRNQTRFPDKDDGGSEPSFVHHYCAHWAQTAPSGGTASPCCTTPGFGEPGRCPRGIRSSGLLTSLVKVLNKGSCLTNVLLLKVKTAL